MADPARTILGAWGSLLDRALTGDAVAALVSGLVGAFRWIRIALQFRLVNHLSLSRHRECLA